MTFIRIQKIVKESLDYFLHLPNLPCEVKSSFVIPEPKKKFQPKVKGYKKINNDKGIF